MGRNSHLQSCGDVGVQSEDDTERTAFGPDFTELYKPAIKYGIKWQNMPVEIGDLFFFVFSWLRRHMISAIQGRCCDIAMKHPACLRDKKAQIPPPPLPASPLLSTLYFCNWRCYNEINSVAITDFTSCYQPPLEEPSHEKASKNIPLSCIINIFII